MPLKRRQNVIFLGLIARIKDVNYLKIAGRLSLEANILHPPEDSENPPPNGGDRSDRSTVAMADLLP